MKNLIVQQTTSHTCSQCGSKLILVSQETIQPEGSRYQQTNSVYRCANVECQKRKDKEKEERLKQREKKIIADQQRQEKNQEKRAEKVKVKLPED